MSSFRNVVLSLIGVSVLAIACNKSSDSTAAVSQATGKAKSKVEAPTAPAKTGASTIDVSKMTEPQKRHLESTARDVIQIRNMAREMDRLFVQMWTGYWNSKDGRSVGAVNNVFRMLEVALKSTHDDKGLPFLSPFATLDTKPNAPVQVEVAPKQGSRKKSTVPQVVSPGVGSPVAAKCAGDMYQLAVTKTGLEGTVEVPTAYDLIRLACLNNSVTEYSLAQIRLLVAPNGGKYTRIEFNQTNLTNELGMGLSIFARKTPFCQLVAKDDGQVQLVQCSEIGQNIDSNVFVALEDFVFSRSADQPLSGKWIEFALNPSGKPLVVTEKKIIDSMKDGKFVFQELLLTPIEKVPEALAEVVDPAAPVIQEKPAQTPPVPEASPILDANGQPANVVAPPTAPAPSAQKLDAQGNPIPEAEGSDRQEVHYDDNGNESPAAELAPPVT